MLLIPYLRALSPLLGAVVVGAFAHGMTPDLGAVKSGECETFAGHSLGNDPSQHMVLTLCREGTQLEGVRVSEGEAGLTVFSLSGTALPGDRVWLEVSGVERDEPAAGWVSCHDDVFQLRWDARSQSLVGRYLSEACQDNAALALTRM